MFNLDPSKLLVIAVLGVIILGPEKLPQAARRLAALRRSYASLRQRLDEQVHDALGDFDVASATSWLRAEEPEDEPLVFPDDLPGAHLDHRATSRATREAGQP